MGDGGFGMTSSELATAVDYGINTVTIVMNNQCWGLKKPISVTSLVNVTSVLIGEP